MGPEEFRAAGHELIDWIADYRGRVPQVVAAPGWRVLAPVNLQTVALRHEPAGTVSGDGAVLDPGALDAHTLGWADWINASGAAHLTPSLLGGTWSVRVSIGAEPTERHDVERLWRLLREAVESY